MSISLIYARSEDRCIGRAGGIPWHLPDDFAHFKATSLGHPVIMGRKTYEDHNCALPGRLNIVVTRRQGYQAEAGIELAQSLEQAIAIGEQHSDRVFVIGGADFFSRGFSLADSVFETIVHAHIDGDVYIPVYDFTAWTTQVLLEHPQDERHQYAFTILKHSRQ